MQDSKPDAAMRPIEALAPAHARQSLSLGQLQGVEVCDHAARCEQLSGSLRHFRCSPDAWGPKSCLLLHVGSASAFQLAQLTLADIRNSNGRWNRKGCGRVRID